MFVGALVCQYSLKTRCNAIGLLANRSDPLQYLDMVHARTHTVQKYAVASFSSLLRSLKTSETVVHTCSSPMKTFGFEIKHCLRD